MRSLHRLAVTSFAATQPVGTGGGAGPGPFALDGTKQFANSSSTGALALPAFSTTYDEDIIYIGVITNGGPVTSITGGGLTWAVRTTENSGGTNVEIWYAKAATALSGVVFTVNTTSAAFITAAVFAVSGASYASPFDANASIPEEAANGVALSISTTTADDILIVVSLSGGSNTIDAPYTSLHASDFLSVGYQILTGTVSGQGATWNSGGSLYAAVADAVVPA